MKKIVLVTAVLVMVAGQAIAFDPSGSYSFKEKGMSGSMEVKEVGASIEVNINTSTKDARSCSIEAKGTRTISSDKSIDASFAVNESTVKFETLFTPKGATIKMTSEGGNDCGMNAFFDGKWVKNSGNKKGKK